MLSLISTTSFQIPPENIYKTTKIVINNRLLIDINTNIRVFNRIDGIDKQDAAENKSIDHH